MKSTVAAALSLFLQSAGSASPTLAPDLSAKPAVCSDAPEGAASPESVLFPATGQMFTLPPEESAVCPEVPAPLVRPPAPNIFGSIALPVKTTKLNWRWDQARPSVPAGISTPWDGIAAAAQQLESREKLALVNSWVNNTIRFAEDNDRDHWASAAETFRNGAGDCEDFAIAKLTVLLAAGLPIDGLFLIVVRDTARNTDHAVLGVRLEGQMLVLDSRTDRILPSGVIADYRPIFSFSGAFAWTHGYVQGASLIPGR